MRTHLICSLKKRKKAIPGKKKKISSSIPDKYGGKKTAQRKGYEIWNVRILLKIYINWICSFFLKCWVSMCSNVAESSGQKELCSQCLFWVWFCILHSETPNIIKPVYSHFSLQWRNHKSCCIAYVQNNYILEYRCYIKINDSHFFPPLTNLEKYKLWDFLPAAFQMLWLGMCEVIKVWQLAFLFTLHWHLSWQQHWHLSWRL